MRRSGSSGGRPSLALRVKNDVSKIPKSRASTGLSSTGRQTFAGKGSTGKSRPTTSITHPESVKRRRSSMLHYGGYHDQIKDPRPIGDRSYKDKCIRELIAFLADKRYPHPISPKLLHSPTSKDFVRIFEFLNGFFHPNYKCGQKIEEEIPRLFRSYGYPFLIPKSAMFTVGSPHTWPTLLAALSWMQDRINVTLGSDIDMLLFPPTDQDGFDCVPEKKILYDFMEKSYTAFLNGADDFEQLEQELEKKLRDNNTGNNLEDLADANLRLRQELAQLQEQPDPLREQRKTLDSLRHDVSTMDLYVSNLASHKQTQQREIQTLNEEMQKKSAEIEQLQLGISRKKQIRETQEFSQADIERINLECTDFQRQIAHADNSIEDLDKQIWNMEISISKAHNKNETKCREFNKLGQMLRIIPVSAENSGGVDFELPSNSAQLSKSMDIVRNSLLSLKRSRDEKLSQLFEQKLKAEEGLEQLDDMLRDQKDTVQKLEAQHRRAEERIESQRVMMCRKLEQKEKELSDLDEEVSSLRNWLTDMQHTDGKNITEEKARLDRLQQQRQHEEKQYSDFLIKAAEMVVTHKSKLQEEAAKLASRFEAHLEGFHNVDDSKPSNVDDSTKPSAK